MILKVPPQSLLTLRMVTALKQTMVALNYHFLFNIFIFFILVYSVNWVYSVILVIFILVLSPYE